MTPEQLERAITEYLDGTLPPEEIAALEQRLATDPVAQVLRAEHEKLTAMLRADPLPEMEWAELARDFSAVVTGNVDEASRAQEQKLNAILKSAAPLPAIRWEKLSERISAALDAELVATDASDAELDAVLKSAPIPELNWDRLASHLSSAVASELSQDAPVLQIRPTPTPAGSGSSSTVAGRIGFTRAFRRIAMAACVAVAATIGLRQLNHSTPIAPTNPGKIEVAVNQPPVVEIEAPTVELANKPPVAEISIGPSNSYAVTSDEGLYRRGVASRPAIVIAVPARPANSTDDDADAYAFE
jgi:hypothetical protein